MLEKTIRREAAPHAPPENLRSGWRKTCDTLGLGKFDVHARVYSDLTTIHDLRRNAARNLIRAGVDRGTVMSIAAHKTESIFKPYNIKNIDDRKEALIKVGRYTAKQSKRGLATSMRRLKFACDSL